MENRKKLDLIVKNARIYTMNRNRDILNRGSLAIQGDRIAMIESSDLSEVYDAGQVIDANGMALFPGFINTHIHFFQSFLKGLGADHRLIEWLNLSALPYGTKMTPRQHELAARLASMEALKSGCTAICEFFYTNQDPKLAYACMYHPDGITIKNSKIKTRKEG